VALCSQPHQPAEEVAFETFASRFADAITYDLIGLRSTSAHLLLATWPEWKLSWPTGSLIE
jgi:hypothetical protein